MSPSLVSRGNFERLLAAAALVEMLHLIGLFARRVEVDGTILAILFTLGGPPVVLLPGFGVTRLSPDHPA